MDAFYSVYNRKLEETKQNDTNADDVFVTQEELSGQCDFDISDQKKAMLRDKRLLIEVSKNSCTLLKVKQNFEDNT